jgi:tetratricopeptide (TPR) repeat protein
VKRPAQLAFAPGGTRPAFRGADADNGDVLLRFVDFCLIGSVCVAPFFFGGRHDLGRLVFVALVALASTAWFVRQAIRPTTSWKDTAAFGLMLLAAGLLILQIAPLPTAWIHWIAPRNAELLPLWQPTGGGMLGNWRTVSLTPHETTKSLAMLVAYGLLFAIVVQRIDKLADTRRVLRWVAVSAVLMATFGLVQYFASNGKFFWFYEHPYRRTSDSVCGSFINRNHFAGFLVLGVGPLVAWLLESMQSSTSKAGKHRTLAWGGVPVVPLLVGGALAIVLFAALLSLSRGGTLALTTAVVVVGLIYAHGGLVSAKHLSISVSLAVVVLGMLSFYGYDQVSRRLSSLTQGSMEAIDRGESRRKIWKANFAAFQHGGLAGAGAGSHVMIYPVYLPESLPGKYTHAESSYLQVATETGFVGVVLLAIGLGLCGSWCWTSFRRGRSSLERLCCGAASGGLAASAVHSIVDFVWYIPACMSVTVVLAACMLRLAQLAGNEEPVAQRQPPPRSPLAFGYRLATPLVVAAGAWMVWTYVGPSMAAIHWDRYLRVAVANGDLARQSLSQLAANLEGDRSAEQSQEAMLDAMLRHLERVIAWDPHFAEAHLRLTAHQLSEFQRRQQLATNVMEISQIRDAALASQFKSPAEVCSWLDRAFGENWKLLQSALEHAHAGLAECPLQEEGYLALAQLGFLEGADRAQVAAYLQQGLRVRPFDGSLLFEVGKQALVDGNFAVAKQYWQKCFRDVGPHQLKIIYLLAGSVPAEIFVDDYRPDWHTLPMLWARYRELGQPQDLSDLLTYAAGVTDRQAKKKSDVPLDNIWYWQASMYQDVKQSKQALLCLRKAYKLNPHEFEIRYALGRALMKEGQFAEAEPHFRWCSARRPQIKDLSAALVEISKQRSAARDPNDATMAGKSPAWQ